jgi:FAD dependent oxidoreductase TIGR03364
MQSRSAIVIGAGVVGLATARALALQGFSVRVFERSDKAVGASIRNFGMIWPIGQTAGKMYDRAIRSRDVWKEVAPRAGFWHEAAGSLHLAYHPDEWQVLQELYEVFRKEGRPVQLMNTCSIAEASGAVVTEGLLGGLYSRDEVIVDPREAISVLPGWLTEELSVEFYWANVFLISPIRSSMSATKKNMRPISSSFATERILRPCIPSISPGSLLPNANCR